MKRNYFSILVIFALAAGVVLSGCVGEIERQESTKGVAASYLTVRDFGAVGDGKADDSDAFQRAVDSGCGDVRIPRGVYRLTKPVVIELDKIGPTSITGEGTAKVIMAGAGPAFKLVGTHRKTAEPHKVKENVWRNQRMPIISGLEIVGAHPEAVGIAAKGTMQAIFSRLLIRKALHGIHLKWINRNVIISDCHIYDNRGIGIFYDKINLHQSNISNCHISYNGGGGIVVRGGHVCNLQVGNCDIEGNMDPNGPATANVLIDMSKGGLLLEGEITGCTIQHEYVKGAANIRLLGAGPEDVTKAGNLTIADNVLSFVPVNIHIRHGRSVSINGNAIWGASLRNVLVEGSSNILMGPNLLDLNPHYKSRDRHGLLFRDCTDCTLSGLHVSGVLEHRAGLVLERCRGFNISGCSFIDCDGGGILMDDVKDTIVTGCSIRDSRKEIAEPVALTIKSGSDNFITGNLLRGRLEIADGTAQLKNNFNMNK